MTLSVETAASAEAAIYNWKGKYGELEVSDMKRLHADASRTIPSEGSSGENLVTPAAKRETIGRLQAVLGMSQRRARRLA